MFGKKKNKKKTGDKDILVKVGRTGARVIEIALNGKRTVQEALNVAGLSKKDSEMVQVNGEEVDDLDMNLTNGDRVILVKNIQGGVKNI